MPETPVKSAPKAAISSEWVNVPGNPPVSQVGKKSYAAVLESGSAKSEVSHAAKITTERAKTAEQSSGCVIC